jgi:oligopeptide transport system ATP-binding protein
MEQTPLLQVKDLKVSFLTYAGEVQAVRGASFHVNTGEAIAVVGESGCGKSVTAKSIMQLNPSPPAVIRGGSIMLDGIDILAQTEKQMQDVRGRLVSMIFQDPMTSLNPTMLIGKQLTEGIIKHQRLNRAEAGKKALELLQTVQVPDPERRIHQYPFEFSGGMRQRVMIAMALSCNPKLLIADEPTTALDVTIQAQIVDLMKSISQKIGTAIILITHDLGVVASLAKRIVVMYAGRVVESGTSDDIFYRPRHPYTWGLLDCIPRLDLSKNCELTPILGTPPDLIAPPKGCPFADRCKYCMRICRERLPETLPLEDQHEAACWLMHPDAPKVQYQTKGGLAG